MNRRTKKTKKLMERKNHRLLPQRRAKVKEIKRKIKKEISIKMTRIKREISLTRKMMIKLIKIGKAVRKGRACLAKSLSVQIPNPKSLIASHLPQFLRVLMPPHTQHRHQVALQKARLKFRPYMLVTFAYEVDL